MILFLTERSSPDGMSDDEARVLSRREFNLKTQMQRKSVAAMQTATAKMARIGELREQMKTRAKRATPTIGGLSLLVALTFSLSGPFVHLVRAAAGTSTYDTPDIACVCVGFLANFVTSIAVTGMIFEWVLTSTGLQVEGAKKVNAVVKPFHRYVFSILLLQRASSLQASKTFRLMPHPPFVFHHHRLRGDALRLPLLPLTSYRNVRAW